MGQSKMLCALAFVASSVQLAAAIAVTEEPKGMMMTMIMPMWFWKGYEDELTWLFHGVTSTTGGQYCGGLILTFLLGFVLEAIMYLRNYIFIKA